MTHQHAVSRTSRRGFLGSVQQRFVRVQGISGDVLCVGASGQYAAYVGVLEVGGLSYDLKGPQEQEHLITLWQQMLAGIAFPVQVLWRSLPLRLDPYLQPFEGTAQAEQERGSAWQTLAATHVQHVRALAERRMLVQRRIFLVTRVLATPERHGLKGLLWLGPPRQHAAASLEEAREELARRLSGLARHLELLGLPSRRLSGLAELSAFYQSCLCPLTAAQFPLPAELVEGAESFPHREARLAPRDVEAICPECGAAMPGWAMFCRACGRRLRLTPALESACPDTVSGIQPPLAALPEPLLLCPVCQSRTPGWMTACLTCGTPFSEDRRVRFLLPPSGAGQTLPTTQSDSPSEVQPGKRWFRAPFRLKQTQPVGRKTLFPHLADLLAPVSVDVMGDVLKVGNEWQQVFVVRGLPRTIDASWLRDLLELDEPFELSFQLRPQEAEEMERLLRRKHTQLQASKLFALGKGHLVDPHTEIALRDIDELMLKVASSEERMFELFWLVRVWGASPKEVAERARKLQHHLQGMRLRAYPATFEQAPALCSCLPQVRPELDGEGLLLPSETIATAFPFVASSLFHGEGVLVGVTPTQELAVLDPWATTQGVTNANMVIFGPPGQGKSTLAKTLVQRLALRYQGHRRAGELGFQLFVIDPDAEYRILASALGGQTVLLSPGSPDRINPFDLPQPRRDRITGADSEENVLAVHMADLHRLLDIMVAPRGIDGTSVPLAPDEDSLLGLALVKTYEQAGITPDPRTHTRPAPLMSDFVRVLREGDWAISPASLLTRLERFTKGVESGLFGGPTTLDVRSPVVVFDTSACRTEMQQIIAQFLISTFVWGQAFGSRIPRFLVVDEAATWLRYPGGKSALEQYTERARKHFLSVICITQEPETFVGSKLIANSAIKWLHRPDPSSLPVVQKLFGLSEREGERLLLLQQGEALLIVSDRRGSKRLIVKNEISDLELVLAQTDPSVLAEWAEQPAYASLRDLLRQLAAGGLGHLASYVSEEALA